MKDDDVINLDKYASLFVQRGPSYALRRYGEGPKKWITISHKLSNKMLAGHLRHEYAIASRARWYPEFGAFDIDKRKREEVDEIREKLGLDENNSFLCSSESENSYHLFFRPRLNGKPPTRNRLYKELKDVAEIEKVERYPQPNKPFRLPFGFKQEFLDYEFAHLKKVEDILYWIEKLDSVDISEFPKKQKELFDLDAVISTGENFTLIDPGSIEENKSCYQKGHDYYIHGLQAPGTRHDAQFCILYWLWRRNYPLDEAIKSAYRWINLKHNEFSNDYPKYRKKVQKEIIRQATFIYENYHRKEIYPDATHVNYYGYITKPDIEEIVLLTEGNLPFTKFVFSLVKFAYPRRYRQYLNIHTDKLTKWSSRNYQNYFEKLDEKGIAKRNKSYHVGEFSKAIDLNWDYKSDDNAVIYEGRSIDTFQDTIKLLYKPEDFKQILQKTNVPRQNIYYIINSIYEDENSAET